MGSKVTVRQRAQESQGEGLVWGGADSDKEVDGQGLLKTQTQHLVQVYLHFKQVIKYRN